MKKNTGLNAPYKSHQEETLHTAHTRIFYYSDLKKILVYVWKSTSYVGLHLYLHCHKSKGILTVLGTIHRWGTIRDGHRNFFRSPQYTIPLFCSPINAILPVFQNCRFPKRYSANAITEWKKVWSKKMCF
jgi:hypothetical protein